MKWFKINWSSNGLKFINKLEKYKLTSITLIANFIAIFIINCENVRAGYSGARTVVTNSFGEFFNILHRRTNCADMFVDKCFMWTKIPSSEYKKAIVEDLYWMGLTFCFWKSSPYFEQAVQTVYKLPVCQLKARPCLSFCWSTEAQVFRTFN